MDDLTIVILILIIVLVVFFLLREFWTWFFKINQLIEGHKKTNQLLETLIRASDRIADSILANNKTNNNPQANILISGQKESNYILQAAIEESGGFYEIDEKPLYDSIIKYKTINQARNSLNEGYGRLCAAEPELVGKEINGISMFDDALYYKKSKAEIHHV